MTKLSFSIEDILDNMSDGVYVCDRERRIVYWSKAAERITRWTAADVVGRRCLEDVLNHVDKDGHRLCGEEYCPLHRSMVTGTTTRVPVIVYALGKDGRRIPMHVTAAPLRNADGDVIGGVESFRDVTPILSDLQRAGKIQQQILEQQLPEDPRLRFSTFCMPHDIVGGDFYAIRQLGIDGILDILKRLNYPQSALSMPVLEKELLKFSNEIRLQDDVTIIEIIRRESVE